MKKIRLTLVLCFILGLTACFNDNYKSVRHPKEDIENTQDINNSKDSNQDKAKEEEGEKNQKNKDSLDGVEFKVKDTVNMRLAPSADSAIVLEVKAEDEILNLGETDGWTRVTVNGKTGYIRSDLLIRK